MLDSTVFLEMPLYNEKHIITIENLPNVFNDGTKHHWLPLQIKIKEQISKNSNELLDFYNDSLYADVFKNEIKIYYYDNDNIAQIFYLYNCKLIPNKNNLYYMYKIEGLKFEIEFGDCVLKHN